MSVPNDTSVTGTVARPGDITEEDRAELIRKAKLYDEHQASLAATEAAKPQFYKVVVSNPEANNRVIFRSVSQKRAMTWVENHVPRGGEVHLLAPDGTITNYEQERTGEKGMDAEQWQSYDPADYVSRELGQAPGQDAWSDSEG
jgi:hypothetical protein